MNKERKAAKVRAVADRLMEMRGNTDLLIGMLDETKLDMLLLALGLAEVELNK